jgi:alanine racemase
MWQAEIRVDLGAIRDNVARLRTGTKSQLMAVVKANGYGHGMVESARAAIAGGATWLGACTIPEALRLRHTGFDVPILAWLWAPDAPVLDALRAHVDLSVASQDQLRDVVAAARRLNRTARVHLKIDSGLHRNGATTADWGVLVEAAAKAQADDDIDVVGAWSHLAVADEPGHPSIDRQLSVFHDGLDVVTRAGLAPQVRHLANSAATLTRPDTHFDLVRPGLAIYGLSPVAGTAVAYGLRPAMTVRARVALVKRVPAGDGVSYGHTYTTSNETTLALVPIGYADGVPRHASNAAPVFLAGDRRTIAGRVCMDQIVLDCGDAEVRAGDVAVLFGPGTDGEPTAEDWAAASGTINYEIVTRIGSSRVARVYDGPDHLVGGDHHGDETPPR